MFIKQFKARNFLKLFLGLIFCGNSAMSQIIDNPLIRDKSQESIDVSEIILTDTSTIVNLLIDANKFPLDELCPQKKIVLKEAANQFRRAKKGELYSLEKSNALELKLVSTSSKTSCNANENSTLKSNTAVVQLVFSKLSNSNSGFLDLVAEGFTIEGICLNDGLAHEISMYQKAFEEFESGNKDSALTLFKKVLELNDTMNIMFRNSIFNIAVLYELKGEKKKASSAYKQVLESNFNDLEPIDGLSGAPCNFKHQACLRLAEFYKQDKKYKDALQYYWLADTTYDFLDTTKLLKRRDEVLILGDKLLCYDSLRLYDMAIYYGISKIVNEEAPRVYDAQAKALVGIIKKNFNYKKFVNDFDKSLKDLIVFESADKVFGKFRFLEKDIVVEVNKDYTIMEYDQKSKKLIKASNQEKNQDFFIQRVKLSDFYISLKSKG
jgi:tetratricopeptide (TPR) repeat protein